MKTFDRLLLFCAILALAAVIVLLNSCTVSKVTVQGKLGEYSFKPYRAIVIEPEK